MGSDITPSASASASASTIPSKRAATPPVDSAEPSKKEKASMASSNHHDASQPEKSTQSFLVQKLKPNAQIPKRGSDRAAGYDLFSAAEAVVPARGKALISTGLCIAVPEGTYGRVAPRSGLASKFMIDVGAGVIDADYRGEVRVLLFNLSDSDYKVTEGDRIAQLILERIVTPDAVEVESLTETLRGAGGFGSTGKA